MGRRLVAVLHFWLVLVVPLASASHDYGMALSKSILFFEAQRSGYLPKDQRVTWRADSALTDGKANGVDLVGGYYDGGDNVKFGLPLAFTITMMSWSILEYGEQLATTGELDHATEALKWGTDYLIKAHPEPNVLYAEVGDGDSDHSCWQRPEDMTTSREAYRIDADHPGSEVAGETAAAMASASMVFRLSNPAYSSDLLNHAKQLFEFADKYRGNYHESIPIVKKYYQSFSGYADELLWAAVWLFHATDDRYYLDYLGNNGDALNGTRSSMIEFSWDVKFVGLQILASKFLLQGKAAHHSRVFKSYQKKAEFFVCSCLGKGSRNIQKTPGGLIFLQGWNNLQYATAASFLLSVYSDYLESAGRNVHCSSGTATPAELLTFAKSQVDYILGDNPSSISYMVGYGSAYPQRIYHRPSSIVSVKVDSTFVSCKGGYAWFGRNASNPNLLDGAVVGGPDAYDDFADDRGNFKQNEPTTYNNAPLIGALARLGGGRSSCSQLLSAAKPFSPITVEQTTVATWNGEGKTYHKYSVKLTNNSTLAAEDLCLNVSKMNVTLRGHKKSSSTYGLPTRLDSLPAGKSFEFVYVNSDSAAHVCITGYTLV